jgi:PST family polysaccharide transporter
MLMSAAVERDVSGSVRTRGTLGQRTMRGLLWMSIGTWGQVVVQIVVVVILARYVPPRGFGLVAAALVVVRLSLIFADSGIGPALVQRRNIRSEHIRVAFTVTVLLGAMSWGFVFVSAPWIAAAFGMPDLVPILRVIGSVFLLRSLTVGDHLLERELEFRRLGVVELISLVVGYGAVAVFMGVTRGDAWAIVWAQIAWTGLRTGVLWCVRPHPIRPSLAREPLSQLVRFGGGLIVAQLAAVVATEGDNFVVGSWLGAYALGLYSRAYQLLVVPALLFGTVLNRVLFPAMAALHGDQERLRRSYMTGTAVIAALTLPLTVILFLSSREFVLVVLGAQWLPLLGALRILILCAVFRTNYMLGNCLALAVGAVYRRATRQWAYAGFVLVGSLIGQRWGLPGVATGVALALIVNYLLVARLSLRITASTWSDYIQAHAAGTLLASVVLVVSAPSAAALRALDAPATAVLLGTVCSGILVILGAIRTARSIPVGDPVTVLSEDLRLLIAPGKTRNVIARVIGRSHRSRSHEPGTL